MGILNDSVVNGDLYVNGYISSRTGPSGPSGLVGPNGASGPCGPCGPCGPSGFAGVSGPCGPSGPQGPSGLRGVSGVKGPSGSKGDTGATSKVQGPCGPSGFRGASGVKGPTGYVGATGARGPCGPCGPKGSTGATGKRGYLIQTYAQTGTKPTYIFFGSTTVTFSSSSPWYLFIHRLRVSLFLYGTFSASYTSHLMQTDIELTMLRNGSSLKINAQNDTQRGSTASVLKNAKFQVYQTNNSTTSTTYYQYAIYLPNVNTTSLYMISEIMAKTQTSSTFNVYPSTKASTPAYASVPSGYSKVFEQTLA